MSSQIVQGVLNTYPGLTLVPESELAARRQQFLPAIIAALADPDWGVLEKTGGKIQDDIVIRKSNLRHFDCMTAVQEGTLWRIKSVWKDQGIIPTHWNWKNVKDANIPPLPGVEPPEEPPVDPPTNIEAKVDLLLSRTDEILDILQKHFRE